MSESKEKNVLFITLCLAAVVIVSICSFFLYDKSIMDILKALSTNVLSALFIFLFIYLVFINNGVDIDNLIKSRANTLPNWIENAYESFYDINWKKYIIKSKKIIVISFYLEDWLEKHKDELTKLMEKNNSTIDIVLPNYKNEDLLKEITVIIPKYKIDGIKSKIRSSIVELKELNDSSNKTSKINIYLCDKLFNYTIQVLDKKTVFLSVNELSRKGTYKSPFFQINLTKNSKIKSFFNEEINSIKLKSKKINIDDEL